MRWAAAATAASAEARLGASTSTANGSYPPSTAITESYTAIAT